MHSWKASKDIGLSHSLFHMTALNLLISTKAIRGTGVGEKITRICENLKVFVLLQNNFQTFSDFI